MPVNRMGLRHFPIKRLRVGDSMILGPYKSANTVASIVSRVAPGIKFVQRKLLLVDEKLGFVRKVWIINRTE